MKYRIFYTCPITIEVEANDDDQAFSMADAVLESMTGADFRENTDYQSMEEIKEDEDA